MLFNLDFANNKILSCFFLFFLIINLHFLIPTVITQIFYPIRELVIPIPANPLQEYQLKKQKQKYERTH